MSTKGLCNFDCGHCPWGDCVQGQVSKRDYEENGQPIPWELSGDQALTKGTKRGLVTKADAERGKALKACRLARGLSANKAAQMLGVAGNTISQWERGRCPNWDRVSAVFPEFDAGLEPLPTPVMTIQELFESTGLSTHRFGCACGVSSQTVCNWLNGKAMKQYNLKKIIQAFPEFIGKSNDK